MHKYIEPLSWHPDMWKRTIDQEDIQSFNKDIHLYNILSEGEEKQNVSELLKLRLSNPIGVIVKADIGEPLKDELSEEEELRRRELHFRSL